MTYILDGYNVLRHVLRETAVGDLAAQRFALEQRLRRFRAASGPGTRVFIVYDGERGIPAPARLEKGFEVLFSKPPRQADDLVLELARRLEGEPEVCVVTSDLIDIARRLRGLRLEHLTSQAFAARLERKLGPGRAPEPTAEKPAAPTAGEVDEWVRLFGFGDEPGGEDRRER